MKDFFGSIVKPTLFGVYSILCLLFFIFAGFSVGALLVLIAGLLVLPSKFNLQLWKEKGGKFVFVLCAVSLVILAVGVILLPPGTFSKMFGMNGDETENSSGSVICDGSFDYSEIPPFDGYPYVELNGNVPYFSRDELNNVVPFERYSELDEEGRCGPASAAVCVEIMPVTERESISSVKPTGWQNAKYDFIENGYLYNRCHLIGFQLSGESANPRNIITGTRFFNVSGMLPFENRVAEYVNRTRGTVLYRVTPVFTEGDAVCRGVIIEAYSVDDDGGEICFNVFVYNEQPGVIIDRKTGKSEAVR